MVTMNPQGRTDSYRSQHAGSERQPSGAHAASATPLHAHALVTRPLQAPCKAAEPSRLVERGACSGSEVNQERWRTAVRAVVALHSMRSPKPPPVHETDEEDEEEEKPPAPGAQLRMRPACPATEPGRAGSSACMQWVAVRDGNPLAGAGSPGQRAILCQSDPNASPQGQRCLRVPAKPEKEKQYRGNSSITWE